MGKYKLYCREISFWIIKLSIETDWVRAHKKGTGLGAGSVIALDLSGGEKKWYLPYSLSYIIVSVVFRIYALLYDKKVNIIDEKKIKEVT